MGWRMGSKTGVFTAETFRFFRELGKNNHKPWMDANRERYQDHVVAPFRALLDALAPAVLKLDRSFDTGGRTGVNFSRINRDIRFTPNRAPYYTQMYLTFVAAGSKGRSSGQLYVGLSDQSATTGFRIYSESSDSKLSSLTAPRAAEHAAWLKRQKQRLSRKYESYWYSMEKREWTKHDGWPLAAEDWKRIQGWIVRKTMKPAAATRPAFVAEVTHIFHDLFPIYSFTSSPRWKA
jgi:uncharacterized protein (TIGR02453 family)